MNHTLTQVDPLDPSMVQTIEVKEYLPYFKVSHKIQAVVIIPPTGGENFLDRGLAKYLSRQGLRVVIAQKWDRDNEPLTQYDLKRHDRLHERAVRALQKIIDWMGCSHVAVVGASLGGIYGSMLAGLDPRVERAVIVAAGGSLADVVAYGDQELLNNLRSLRFKNFKYTSPTQYAQALHTAIEWDTSRFARPEHASRISFVISDKDRTVPASTQWTLYKAWGSPERLKVIKNDHVLSIVRTYQFNRAWILASILS